MLSKTGQNGGSRPDSSATLQIAVRPITPNPASLWHILEKPLKRDRIRASARKLIAQITRPTATRSRRGRPSPTKLK
jgi:hypothetical protein